MSDLAVHVRQRARERYGLDLSVGDVAMQPALAAVRADAGRAQQHPAPVARRPAEP